MNAGEKQTEYVKDESFRTTYSRLNTDIAVQEKRALAALARQDAASALPAGAASVLDAARSALESRSSAFEISVFKADEMATIDDDDLPRWLYHRYRYDVFPRERRLDSYPPYFQVEPTSICNFRCIFCYQIDETFSSRRSNMMGSMDLGLFREVVDEISGSVEFGSLASRGEPLICKDIDKMLAYTRGKFLNLKMNTNASLLKEAKCHAILSSGLGSLVFSADAAREPDYSRFRVRGSLKTTLANVRLFENVRRAHYPDTSLITRVSGVMYDPAIQNMQEMVSFWGDLVDQVSFVEYDPWENVYEADASEISTPCSELWRRFFLWYDGTTNPCETDYKSLLSPGIFPNEGVSSIWCGEPYERLRKQHLQGQRGECYPCRNCYFV